MKKAENWKVPRRVMFITEGGGANIGVITSDILRCLWGNEGSGIALDVVLKGQLSKGHIEKIQSERSDTIELRAYVSKEFDVNKEKQIKDVIAKTLGIFKPSVLIIDSPLEFVLTVLREAVEIGVPVVINKDLNSPAIKYYIESPRFNGRVSSYVKGDVLSIPLIADICKKILHEEKASLNAVVTQTKLRVAGIMDTFTHHSYMPECNLLELTPKNIIQDLSGFNPDMLFVESAWKGKDDLWDRKIANPVAELKNAIDWCRERLIPTIFWNKEDPVHFETFITTASMFDYVFTTDIDCIGAYKQRLGHDRIYLLPFACQPKNHNPVETYKRKDAFCFAGAYYVKYPERIKDLEGFVGELTKFKALEIYDRNYEKNDPNYQFPADYKPYIVGTLPFDEIDKAYKGYNYSINLNSIKQSQTMFARRVYELLGCNTLTVSNFSRGLKRIFGDLTICSDNGRQVAKKIQDINSKDGYEGKLKLNALRKIMLEHTYEVRLRHITSKVMPRRILNPLLPKILVLGVVKSNVEIKNLIKTFKHQSYQFKKLLLIKADDFLEVSDNIEMDDDIELVSRESAVKNFDFSIYSGAEWISNFNASDYYGRNYLIDLALATKYSTAEIIGKKSYYKIIDFNCTLIGEGQTYKYSDGFNYASSMISVKHIKTFRIETYLSLIKAKKPLEKIGFSVDQFNYCENSSNSNGKLYLEKVNDIQVDAGIPIDDLNKLAESIPPNSPVFESSPGITSEGLVELFQGIKSKNISILLNESGALVVSTLSDGDHDYVYAKKLMNRSQFSGAVIDCYVDVAPGLNLQFVLRFLDKNKKIINYKLFPANTNQSFEIPEFCDYVLIGMRAYQSGSASIKKIDWRHRDPVPSAFIGSDVLLVTNQYPSYENLYKNGFVHARALNYINSGLQVDIFTPGESEINFREYEGVNVIEGTFSTLAALLKKGLYKNIFVHFLTPDMWNILRDFVDQKIITIWLHGSDIQSYHHRSFLYETSNQIDQAKKLGEERNNFWKEIINKNYESVKFVFVSNYLSKIVQSDLGISIDKAKFTIIHNGINIDSFRYGVKKADDRLKILSIRPYASKVYANDLTIKVILELSKKPFFEQLSFTLVGDGVLFDETVEPIKHFKNVTLFRKFLDVQGLIEMHADHGIFLCPTRMDTQGVSRDEAMSSGLVPITNKVAAIPEFVDSNTGFAVDSESYLQLADSIEFLFKNPEAFLKLSEASARSVRENRSHIITTDKEIKFTVGSQGDID